jgi:hypothetical protein
MRSDTKLELDVVQMIFFTSIRRIIAGVAGARIKAFQCLDDIRHFLQIDHSVIVLK